MLDDRGSIPAEAEVVSLRHYFQTGYDAQPASYPMGMGVPCPGIKRQGREADHLSPSAVEINNPGHYTSVRPSWLHGVVFYVIKRRDNFTFFYIFVTIHLCC
jgi:hypothetical protein